MLNFDIALNGAGLQIPWGREEAALLRGRGASVAENITKLPDSYVKGVEKLI